MLIKLELDMPEKVLSAFSVGEEEVAPMLKKELAVYFFEKDILSFGQARELSGLCVWDFIELLKERKVPLHYDLLEYKEDLKTIREM